MNLQSLIDIRKMCWPAYLYFFTYVVIYAITYGYYAMYKKNLCSTVTIDKESIETCIMNCTIFNPFYNFIILLLCTFILNLFCRYGSYLGWSVAALIYLFSLTPLIYIIKLIMDKEFKQTDLKC